MASGEQSTRPDWMLVCKAGGVPLYWIAADGVRRPPEPAPPRGEWAAEMRESGDASNHGL